MAATFNRRADVYQGETGAKGGETLFRGKREDLVVTYQLYFLCRVGGVVQLLFVCFLFWKDGCYLSLHPGSSLQLSAAGNISRQESSKGSFCSQTASTSITVHASSSESWTGTKYIYLSTNTHPCDSFEGYLMQYTIFQME